MTQDQLFTLILTEAAKAGVREMQAVCEMGALDVFINGGSQKRLWLYNNLRRHVHSSVYLTVSSIEVAPPIVAKPKPVMLADVLAGKAELPGPKLVTSRMCPTHVRSRLANAFLGTAARHFRSDALLDNVIVDGDGGVEIGRIPRKVIENGTDEELRAEVWCSDCGKTYANQISKCRRDGQTVCGDCLGPVVVIHKAQTVGATRVITSAEEYERLYGRKPDPSLFAPKPLMFLPLPDYTVTEDRTYHIEELTLGRRPHGYACNCWLCELGTNGPWHEHEAASRVDYGGECAKAAGYGLRTWLSSARTERDCWPEDDR